MDQAKVQITKILVEFLNKKSDADPPERAQAVKVFELLKQLDELYRKRVELQNALPPTSEIRKYPREMWWCLPPFTAAEEENLKRCESLCEVINAALSRFRFTPVVGGGYPIADVQWSPVGRFPRAEISDYLHFMLDALKEGWLERFRQCQCGQWFFAHTNKKAVCSDACRFQKFKEGKDTFNKERAEYMKKYRSNPRVKVRKEANGKTRK